MKDKMMALNTPGRVSRIYQLEVNLKLVAVDCVHRVIASVSEPICIEPEALFKIIEEAEFEVALSLETSPHLPVNVSNFLTHGFRIALLTGIALFPNEEADGAVETILGDDQVFEIDVEEGLGFITSLVSD